MKRLWWSFWWMFGLCAGAIAAPVTPAERKEILDAARPAAEQLAGQPVKFKIDRLNVDSNWAVIYGELVNASGGPIDWEKARLCDADLDKSLWIVLAKTDARWRVAQIDICSPEPPYWYIRHFDWPCGVYAGFDDGEQALEQQCRAAEKDRAANR